MRRFTTTEAVEALETMFNVSPDFYLTGPGGRVEATIADIDTDRAQSDVGSYLAVIAAQIDPDSIAIRRDVIEGSDLDAITITFMTGENA